MKKATPALLLLMSTILACNFTEMFLSPQEGTDPIIPSPTARQLILDTSIPLETEVSPIDENDEVGALLPDQPRLNCGENLSLIAILIDPFFWERIQPGLVQYIDDLCTDGFAVLEYWHEFSDPILVREFLAETYFQSEGALQGAILIGEIPHAYQWFLVTHTNPNLQDYDEEVISYQYFSDLDGLFEKSPEYSSPAGHEYSYDIHEGEMEWELWVGVLPIYQGNLDLTVEALNRYFTKNHAYRIGEYDIPRRTLIVNEHHKAQTAEDYQYHMTGLKNGKYSWTAFSQEEDTLIYFDAPSAGISVADGYQALAEGKTDFAVLAAHGYWGGHGQLELAWLDQNQLQTVFFWSDGCSVGNLDYPENFLTEVLYNPMSQALVAKGTTNNSGGMGTNQNGFYGHNIAQGMSEGFSIGEAILSHVNVPLIEPWAGSRELHYATFMMLGDPTLKLR